MTAGPCLTSHSLCMRPPAWCTCPAVCPVPPFCSHTDSSILQCSPYPGLNCFWTCLFSLTSPFVFVSVSSVSQQCLESSRYYRYLWKKCMNKRMNGSRFLLPFPFCSSSCLWGTLLTSNLSAPVSCLRLRTGCGYLSVMGAVSPGSWVPIFPELQEGRDHALVQAQAESMCGAWCPLPALAWPGPWVSG